MDPLQQPQARLADDKAQPLHNLTGAARRRSSGPLPSLGAPMASPSKRQAAEREALRSPLYPPPLVERPVAVDGEPAPAAVVAQGAAAAAAAPTPPSALREPSSSSAQGGSGAPGAAAVGGGGGGGGSSQKRRVTFSSPKSLVQEQEQGVDAPRPFSPPFAVKREAVEEILEKPRYSAGWYRKAKRVGEEGGEGESSSEEGGGSGHESDERPPLSPSGGVQETWSLLYQEPTEMLRDLQTRADGVNAVDRSGWAALHWAALLGKERHARVLLDTGADCRAATTSSVGKDVHTGDNRQQNVRLPQGSTPLDIVHAATKAIAPPTSSSSPSSSSPSSSSSSQGGGGGGGNRGSAAPAMATGHPLIAAWLEAAEKELQRKEEVARWEARLAAAAADLARSERQARAQASAQDAKAALDATADSEASLDAGDGDRALRYALGAVEAMCGQQAPSCWAQVKEQLEKAVRRVCAQAKAAGRQEAQQESAQKQALWEEAEAQAEKLIGELQEQNSKGEAYFEREKAALQEQRDAALKSAGEHQAQWEAGRKALAAKSEEVKAASLAVSDAARARREAEREVAALRKRQEKLRSYTDEQVEAKIAAEREKLALAAKLGRKESDERRSSTDVMKAVSNAERSNAKLRDELAQVLHERDELVAQVKDIGTEVQSVKAAWTSDRALIQTLQMQQQAHQGQQAMQLQQTTAMAVQQALDQQQQQQYLLQMEQERFAMQQQQEMMQQQLLAAQMNANQQQMEWAQQQQSFFASPPPQPSAQQAPPQHQQHPRAVGGQPPWQPAGEVGTVWEGARLSGQLPPVPFIPPPGRTSTVE